jgi:hypothetical protein
LPFPPYLFTPFTHTLPSNYLKISSQESTRRRVQPPARFPKDEIPPVLPVGVPEIWAPTDSTPMEAPAVTSLPPDLPQCDKIPSTGPTPLDEGQSVPISRRSLATPEEVLHAHIRELYHALHEALDRLTDADHRISLMEAEFTRFRDIEFSPLRARVAAMEPLNIVPSGDQFRNTCLQGFPGGVPNAGSGVPLRYTSGVGRT